jgi:hypothetical protein
VNVSERKEEFAAIPVSTDSAKITNLLTLTKRFILIFGIIIENTRPGESIVRYLKEEPRNQTVLVGDFSCRPYACHRSRKLVSTRDGCLFKGVSARLYWQYSV